MEVAYLNGGERTTAAGMNLLYAEGDRRASLALDNKCLPYLIGEARTTTLANLGQYIGPRRFFWTTGTRLTGYFTRQGAAEVYDHTFFTNAATAALANTALNPYYNVTQKWLIIQPLTPLPPAFAAFGGSLFSVFNRSLQRHTKLFTPPGGVEETYRLVETRRVQTGPVVSFPVVNAEFYRTTEQAELFFEGVTDLDFAGTWDKYNFFRIHNAQNAPLTIRFRKSDNSIGHTLTVPACESRCIRRTGVNGTYTEGYRYFQKFLPGDVRHYQQFNAFGFACNITNPSLLIPFTNHVLAGIPHSNGVTVARPTVLLDPTVRAPLPAEYVTAEEALYGNPATDTTPLGDCAHHVGEIHHKLGDVITPITFTGYEHIIDAPPEGLLTRIENVFKTWAGRMVPTLQIKSATANGSLISVSTNLLGTGVGQKFFNNPGVVVNEDGKSIRTGANWTDIDGHLPQTAATFYRSLLATNSGLWGGETRVFKWRDAADVEQAIVVSLPLIEPGALVDFSALTLRDRISQFKAAMIGANVTFAPAFALTGSGLVARGTQAIALTAAMVPKGLPGTGGHDLDTHVDNQIFRMLGLPLIHVLTPSPVNGLTLRAFVTSDGTSVSIKRALVFTDYGFPNTDAWQYTGFLAPREPRLYLDITNPANASHPDFSEGLANANGAEVVFTGTQQRIATPIKIASPWNQINFEPTFNMTGRAIAAGMMRTDGPNDGASPRDGLFQALIGTAGNGGQGLGVRMWMNVEHYNNLAAKVNSIAKVMPLNFLTHYVHGTGTTTRTRFFRPNERGILDDLALGAPAGRFNRPSWTGYPYFDAGGAVSATHYREYLNFNYHGLRPKNQYCSFGPGDRPVVADEVEASNAYVAEVVAMCAALGIAIKTQADLPQWSFISAKRRRSLPQTIEKECTDVVVVSDEDVTVQPRGQFQFVEPSSQFYDNSYNALSRVEITHTLTVDLDFGDFLPIDWEETNDLCRPDLNGITNYRWVRVEDIQAAAEALGYKFAFIQPNGPRYDLEVVTIDDFSTAPPTEPISQEVVVTEVRTYPGSDTSGATTWPLAGSITPDEIELVEVTMNPGLEGRTLEFLPNNATGAWVTGCDRLVVDRDRRMGVHQQAIGVDVLRRYGNGFRFDIHPVVDWEDTAVTGHNVRGPTVQYTGSGPFHASVMWHLPSNSPTGFWPEPPSGPPTGHVPLANEEWIFDIARCAYFGGGPTPTQALWAILSHDDYTWTRSVGDTFALLEGTLVLEPSNEAFRKVNWANQHSLFAPTMRNPADYALSATGLQELSYLITETQPTPVSFLSAGWASNYQVLATPVPAFTFPDDYTLTSEAAARTVITRAAAAYPPTVQPTGGTRLQLLADLTLAP